MAYNTGVILLPLGLLYFSSGAPGPGLRDDGKDWFLSSRADKNCTEVPLDVKINKGPVTDSVCQEVRPH